MKIFVLLLCLALVLPASSCAGDKALLITGESLDAVGQQFIETGAAMNAALEAKVITPPTYARWAVFARKFKQSFPLARHLWEAAADARDEKLQAQATAVVAQMVLDLGGYAALVGVKP